MLTHVRRIEVLGLLACAALFAGCGDEKHVATATAADHSAEATISEWQRSRAHELDAGAKTRSVYGSASAATASLQDVASLANQSDAAGQGTNAGAINTPQWGRVVVLPAETSAADAVEPFYARPVRIELAPEAKKLSVAELDRARARAFGVQWEPSNDFETEYAVHRKAKTGCARSRSLLMGTSGGSFSLGTTYKGKEQPVYEIALSYLGNRDGNRHYLLEAGIWEPMSADELATVAGESTPTPWAKSADAIVRSITYNEGFATEVTINYRADGVAEGQRIRKQSYELVYSGEAFRLKLAEHVLLIFGVHEPVPTDGSPCTECAQLPYLVVGEPLAGSPVR